MDESTFKRLMSNKQRLPDPMRYKNAAVEYRRVGNSGLKLPAISLGLWQNFGSVDNFEVMRDMIFTAFDKGICAFDLANNYGPRGGSAEENFGKILKENFSSYRDEMLISTKAGFPMWGGPYGKGGNRKYLVASLDASLKRMGIEYADIYYHHRPDPETPIEETCYVLHQLVERGKALYIGISNYNKEQTEAAVRAIDPALRVHDFRVVGGEKHANLVFEVAAPFECALTDAQIRARITAAVSHMEQNKNLGAVVTVERDINVS